MSQYKLLSLFDGSGSFPLVASWHGIEPVAASEVEPYPIAVTKSKFPNMKHLGDVSKVNGAEIEPVDVITFGSPCQSLSISGKQQGIKHVGFGDEETTKSGLFYEAIRIIKEMREATNGRYPRFAVWENVRNALSSNNGNDFHTVLEQFASVKGKGIAIPKPDKWQRAGLIEGDGFSIAWRVLDAQHFGVPQRRARVYLVADFAGRSAGDILFEFTGASGDSPESGTARKGHRGTAQDSTGDQGVTELKDFYMVENHANDSRCKIDHSGTCQTLTSWMGTGGGNVPLVLQVQKSTTQAKEVSP